MKGEQLPEPGPLDETPAPDVAAAASAAGDTQPEKPARSRSHKKPVTDGGTGSGKGKPTGRGPGRPPKPKLAERLGAMVAGIGVGVAAFNAPDGHAIIAGADELGIALEKWADESPAIRKVLENLLEASAAGMVFVALAKIAIPIAANHGALPPAAAGAAAALAGDVPDYPPADGQQAA